jgi:hypothetical protein
VRKPLSRGGEAPPSLCESVTARTLHHQGWLTEEQKCLEGDACEGTRWRIRIIDTIGTPVSKGGTPSKWQVLCLYYGSDIKKSKIVLTIKIFLFVADICQIPRLVLNSITPTHIDNRCFITYPSLS